MLDSAAAVCDLWQPVLQVFVIDNVLKLVENLDPTVPYFITDHLWYPQPGECCTATLLRSGQQSGSPSHFSMRTSPGAFTLVCIGLTCNARCFVVLACTPCKRLKACAALLWLSILALLVHSSNFGAFQRNGHTESLPAANRAVVLLPGPAGAAEELHIHANRRAPRCLPCDYRDPAEASHQANSAFQFTATKACGCSQQAMCAADSSGLFHKPYSCDWASYWPGYWWFGHGGESFSHPF